LSYCLGKIATTCKPVPYRVKVFPWFARHGVDGDAINSGTFPFCSHFFESFPDFNPLYRLSLLFLFKNHTQFSLSCNTIRNHSCEALRSFPVSGNIITTAASSAPEKNISISGLLIRVFALFPLHFLSGSPVPYTCPDRVPAVYMPDTVQALIRLYLAPCSLAAVNRSI